MSEQKTVLWKHEGTMTQEQMDEIDYGLIRELKQRFICLNLIPHEFTFTQFGLGKMKVTCNYDTQDPYSMTVELI
jgi:hypothetical protein